MSKNRQHIKILFLPYFWLFIFFILPLLIMFVYSFSQRGTYGGVKYIFTISNYINSFDPLYFKLFLRSLTYSFFSTLIALLIGYPIAYYIATSTAKIKAILIFLVILPFWTNFLIRIFSWIVILGTEGMVNDFLIWIGLVESPIELLFNDFSVMLGLVYGVLPYMILPIVASLDKLDKNLLEASVDLGANRFETFYKVTFPLSMQGVVTGIVFVFIPSLGQFVVPDILGGTSTYMIGNTISNQFITVRNWPFGSAMSMLLMLIVSITISLYIRYSKKKY
ncbi:MAG: ABC transporter permease [Bacteroidetes bacterium]|nr:ABC transporter permease [Bacteroidota bacterium]